MGRLFKCDGLFGEKEAVRGVDPVRAFRIVRISFSHELMQYILIDPEIPAQRDQPVHARAGHGLAQVGVGAGRGQPGDSPRALRLAHGLVPVIVPDLHFRHELFGDRICPQFVVGHKGIAAVVAPCPVRRIFHGILPRPVHLIVHGHPPGNWVYLAGQHPRHVGDEQTERHPQKEQGHQAGGGLSDQGGDSQPHERETGQERQRRAQGQPHPQPSTRIQSDQRIGIDDRQIDHYAQQEGRSHDGHGPQVFPQDQRAARDRIGGCQSQCPILPLSAHPIVGQQ